MKTFDTDLALPLIAATRAEAQMKRCGEITALCVLTLARDTLVRGVEKHADLLNHGSPETQGEVGQVYRDLTAAIERIERLTTEAK